MLRSVLSPSNTLKSSSFISNGWDANFKVLSNSFKTSFLFDLRLCNSKQKSPRPTLSKRLFTTSNAAIFSLTNKTVFPDAINSAIKFTIVCDFPVPGGPSTTKLFPFFTSSITAICEESASETVNISLAGNFTSTSCSLKPVTVLTSLGINKSFTIGFESKEYP